MNAAITYWMWTTGSITGSLSIRLDWRKRYLVTGHLTLRDGSNYGHAYIGTVCTYNGGDVRLCGVRDLSGDFDLGIVEVLSGADTVVIKLKATGGKHRAEGVIYEL